MDTFADRVCVMAQEFTRNVNVDLGDERAVMRHLQGASFSSGEIVAGMDMAIDTARIDRVNDQILSGLAGGEWPGAA